MNSIKCPECGLVNFASAAECKRCHLKFHQPEPLADNSSPTSEALPQTADGTETTDIEEPKVQLSPLPDYYNDDPAPFSRPVIFFGICLALTVLAVGYELKQYYEFMNGYQWPLLTDSNYRYAYTPVLGPALYLEFMIKIAVMVSAMTLLMLLLRKSWSFIKWVRVYLIAGLIYQGFATVALLSLRATLPRNELIKTFQALYDRRFWTLYGCLAVGTIALSLVWLGYFSTSERVRRIFIN